MSQVVLITELLKTMTYFRCLPPTESYQWQLIFVRRFQTATGTNGNQWQSVVPMVPLVKLRTHGNSLHMRLCPIYFHLCLMWCPNNSFKPLKWRLRIFPMRMSTRWLKNSLTEWSLNENRRKFSWYGQVLNHMACLTWFYKTWEKE